MLILDTWGFSDFGWLNLSWAQHCLRVSSQLLCLPWVFIIVRHTATWRWGRIQGPVPFINYIRTGILPLASWPRVIAQLVMWSSQTLWVWNWRKYCLLLWEKRINSVFSGGEDKGRRSEIVWAMVESHKSTDLIFSVMCLHFPCIFPCTRHWL